jgi:hypothetical protein
MSMRKLRRRCQARLRDIALPTPFDLDVLFADLARRRGRAIEVLLVDTPISGPCALWVSMSDRDYVLIERGTDPLHRAQMQLHEWAHIVCEHRGALSNDAWTRRLLPDLDPDMVRRVLGRRTYNDDEEAEAEMMASLVLAETDGWGVPGPRQPFDGERGADLDALTRALEGPRHGT